MASGPHAAVAGGLKNAVSKFYSAVAGDQSNKASRKTATVLEGKTKTSDGSESSVSGVTKNKASGVFSSVLGGKNKHATDRNSVNTGE